MKTSAAPAAAVTLLLLLGLGGGALAAAADCNSTSFPVRGAANQLAAAACTTTRYARRTVQGATCDAPLMASQLTKFCAVSMDSPGPVCCATILLTVEQDKCLCIVAEAAEFDLSDQSVARVWEWYKTCGGRRRSVPQDNDSCEPASPPPPPPPPAKPEAPAWPLRLWLAVGLMCAAGVVATIFIALRLWLPRAVPAPVRGHDQGVMLNLHLGDDQETTSLSTAISGPGEVMPRAGAGEDDAATVTSVAVEEEEEASPPVSPVRIKRWSKVARPRLPAASPFEPLPSALVPPGTVTPGARAPPVIRPEMSFGIIPVC